MAERRELEEGGPVESGTPEEIQTPFGDLEIRLTGSTGSDFTFTVRLSGRPNAASLAEPPEEEAESFADPTFNAEGHRIIALIADQDLAQRSPGTHAALHAILDADPVGRNDVRDAAVWPDEIRNQQPETKPFHFVDIPLTAGGPANPPLPPEPHVLSQIRFFSDALKAGNGSAREKADQVSWLFHLFGDVHQPLHCVERTNEFHPAGDRGGNSFRLKGNPSNLHSLWDNSLNIGVAPNGAIGEQGIAGEILQEHSRESLQGDLQETDPEKWARATYRLAKSFAYTLQEKPSKPPRPSSTYLRTMNQIAHRQAALAGYRLADRLRQLLGP
jgi:hypothetical protein